MERDLTIWTSTRSVIRKKMYCIHNLNKRNKYGGVRFCLDQGDLPIYVIREGGGHFEVVNTRGRAYATRNRLRFQTKRKKFKNFTEGA